MRSRFLLPPILLALAIFPLKAACAADLTVSAATSLSEAFREIAAAFTAAHPGTDVRLNFASSGTLLLQISRGAPVDVFASADLQTMDDAQERGLIEADQRRNFASNTLVLITPARGLTTSETQLSGLRDLEQAAFRRIALGNPASVPVGRYTRRALESAGLWKTLESRLLNAQSARQVLDYVARGEVDAGFVYATDAAIMKDKVAVVGPGVLALSRALAPMAPDAAQWLLQSWFQSFAAAVITLALLVLLGWFSSRLLGQRVIGWAEALLERVPLVAAVYGATKRFVATLRERPAGVQRVVLIEFPSPDMKTIGFVTKVMRDEATGEDVAAVYVPTAPNPTSGYIEIVPLSKVVSTDWTMDEAMTFVMTGGTNGPDTIAFHGPPLSRDECRAGDEKD